MYVNTKQDTSYLDLNSARTSAGSPAGVSLRPNRSCIALIAPGWREGCDSAMRGCGMRTQFILEFLEIYEEESKRFRTWRDPVPHAEESHPLRRPAHLATQTISAPPKSEDRQAEKSLLSPASNGLPSPPPARIGSAHARSTRPKPVRARRKQTRRAARPAPARSPRCFLQHAQLVSHQ